MGDAVESVNIMAVPLFSEPPEEEGQVLMNILEALETSANGAQNKIAEATNLVNIKLQNAMAYAPETRKGALEQYSNLQQKLTDAQEKLNPFKAYKKVFCVCLEAKNTLSDFSDELCVAELEPE